MVPIHPQPCPGRADEVRWIIPPTVPLPVGVAHAVPAALQALLDDGTLARLEVEIGAVRTRLRPGHSWRVAGARVRTALHAALDQPAGWRTQATGGSGADARLRAVTRELLDGPVGRYAASHGGSITLVGVHDGVVTVSLGGACHGCPAARFTLRLRLERQLRQRHAAVREVREAGRQ